jgi:hypothetical protein
MAQQTSGSFNVRTQSLSTS